MVSATHASVSAPLTRIFSQQRRQWEVDWRLQNPLSGTGLRRRGKSERVLTEAERLRRTIHYMCTTPYNARPLRTMATRCSKTPGCEMSDLRSGRVSARLRTSSRDAIDDSTNRIGSEFSQTGEAPPRSNHAPPAHPRAQQSCPSRTRSRAAITAPPKGERARRQRPRTPEGSEAPKAPTAAAP